MHGVGFDLSACFFGNHLGGISGLRIINHIRSFLDFFGFAFYDFCGYQCWIATIYDFDMLGFLDLWALPLALYNLPLTIIFSSL